MYRCRQCPRNCGADRETTLGVCRSGRNPVVRACAPHYFEEPPISGTAGSGAIFFAGCPIHCEFCQNIEISEKAEGRTFPPEALAGLIGKLEATGVHNLNFVTPTHFTDKILEALALARPKIPVVWNTSGYETLETLSFVLPYADIFLIDFKYADPSLAARYSSAPDYPETAVRAIDFVVSEKPLRYGTGEEAALLKQGVIVRHLVLPGASENTKRAVRVFAERWKEKAILSLMGQYTPNGKEKHAELSYPLRPLEYKIAVRAAEAEGIENCYIQTDGAVGKEFVPDFNAENVSLRESEDCRDFVRGPRKFTDFGS